MIDSNKFNRKFTYFIGNKIIVDQSNNDNDTVKNCNSNNNSNKKKVKISSTSGKMSLSSFNKLLQKQEQDAKSKSLNHNRVQKQQRQQQQQQFKSVIHQSNLPYIFNLFSKKEKEKKLSTLKQCQRESETFKTVWFKTNGQNSSEIISDLDQHLTFISKFQRHNIDQHHRHPTQVDTNQGIIIDYYRTKSIDIFVPNFCIAAKKCLVVPNAGADLSRKSESVSINYFTDRFNAKDFILECDVQYIFHYKMVDFVCTIYNRRIGCSVTRAMHWQDPKLFTKEMARELLIKKLNGLLLARSNVGEAHSFRTCFLHILCQTQEIAKILNSAYLEILSNSNSPHGENKSTTITIDTNVSINPSSSTLNSFNDLDSFDIKTLNNDVIIIATVFTDSFIYSNNYHDLDHITILF
jgi:hypothetical protein